jgi:hypothetical protein
MQVEDNLQVVKLDMWKVNFDIISIAKELAQLEQELQAIYQQLGEMQQGGGICFWLQPLLHPSPPIVDDDHIGLCYILLQPYGFCKRWFPSFDVVVASCKHTYHPFCRAQLCKDDNKCCVCKKLFHLDCCAC